MKNTIVKFNDLETLARYAKNISPSHYLINTTQTTLAAPLSHNDIHIAVEKYNATIVLPV